MIKIHVESPSENVTLFKNELYDHTSKEIEKIIRTIKEMNNKDIENMLRIIKNMNRRCANDHPDDNLKLVIELNLVYDGIDK